MTAAPEVLEIVPHAESEQFCEGNAQEISYVPVRFAVIPTDWPASMTKEVAETLAMPPPAYPPPPQPARTTHAANARERAPTPKRAVMNLATLSKSKFKGLEKAAFFEQKGEFSGTTMGCGLRLSIRPDFYVWNCRLHELAGSEVFAECCPARREA